MEGIIFDVDGTLWDSTDTVAESWNDAIREYTDMDLTIDSAVLKNVFGKTMTEIGNTIFPSLPKDRRNSLLQICFAYENRLLETKPGKLYDGVYETIQRLSQKYSLFIASNCQCGYVEVLLKTTGMAPFIKDFLCFGQTQTPKSQTIRTLMERNHLNKAVYVGDTQGDFNACREVGIPFIYAAYGFGEVQDAPVTIHSIRQLTELDIASFFKNEKGL